MILDTSVKLINKKGKFAITGNQSFDQYLNIYSRFMLWSSTVRMSFSLFLFKNVNNFESLKYLKLQLRLELKIHSECKVLDIMSCSPWSWVDKTFIGPDIVRWPPVFPSPDTFHYTFPKVLRRKISLISTSLFSWWSFHLYTWP